MDLPFEGASIVVSGHQHTYERIEAPSRRNTTYIVNGLGGNPWLYEVGKERTGECKRVEPGSKFRYNAAHGALFGTLKQDPTSDGKKMWVDLCLYSIDRGEKQVIDHAMFPLRRR